MYNFFVESDKINNYFYITGQDYNHVKNVLRMKVGEEFLVSYNGVSNLCRLTEFLENSVVAEVIKENYQDTSLPITLYLFQGLPKSDKMELIIQKAVELGVSEIIPVETTNCIVKLENKDKIKKVSRWQAISESAAKQSKRTLIPQISNVLSFDEALKLADNLDLFLVPYECKNGMEETKNALNAIKKGMKIGVFIGPEGGFTEKEIAKATERNAQVISLGKRILRTETAAITTLSLLMLHAEMNLN